jgi:hypothetical protein
MVGQEALAAVNYAWIESVGELWDGAAYGAVIERERRWHQALSDSPEPMGASSDEEANGPRVTFEGRRRYPKSS